MSDLPGSRSSDGPAPKADSPDLAALNLPVLAALPELTAMLEAGRNAVLVAPPGAGKTTLVPLALLDAPWRAPGAKIIMLEPRRLAARAAATRMATLLGEQPGERVGFRTRIDSAVSGATRIEVLTEGLFLRRLLSDPLLEDTACVIFDEIHERSLDSDLALAFTLDLQRELRPDLRLIAMSATADTARLTTLLDAGIAESAGRQYPVEIRHAKRDFTHLRDLPLAMATAVREALAGTQGDLLVFLPGTGEIRRTAQALEGVAAEILPLHGELPPAEQARVLTPRADGTPRRVILSTSIAETSLTVPGVRVVIDGGYRRAPRFDQGSGLARLETMRISRAAAAQRAGRAGREAPGIAIRLWTEATGRGMPPHDRPEILDADLSDFVLATAIWQEAMGGASGTLALADPPPNGAVTTARALLEMLGALDGAGSPTPLGRRMSALGTHPRMAAMMLAARDAGEAALAADLAALLEERDPLRPRPAGNGPPPVPPADIRLRLDLIAGGDHPLADRGALARIRQASAQFRRRLGLGGGNRVMAEGDAAALIAAGFPDRLAQSRGEIGSFRLAGGGSAKLGRDDPLASEKLLAVATLFVRQSAGIRLAAPLDANNLPPTMLAGAQEQVETALDPVSGSVIARRRLRLGALILRDRSEVVAEGDAQALLAAQAAEALATTLNWTDAARQFQARATIARDTLGQEALPDLSDAALAASVQEWLTPFLAGVTRLAALKELDLLAMLRARFDHAALVALDRDLPQALTLRGGRVPIDYTAPVPLAQARAQVFYGTSQIPPLAGGRLPLRVGLLSPAGRAQAITADLATFWTGGWADMRRDMRGRYPRHDWPENPAVAEPPKPRP